MVLMGMASCTSFDDPVTENYGAAPGIDVTITPGAQTDSAFTVTITPAAGAAYYAFIIDENDVAEKLDSATLYKGGYGNTVVKVADQPTTTIVIDDATPNTTYQVYAVAGSDKGIVGNVVVKSITTTDNLNPGAKGIARDADNAAVQLTFSEYITRGEGAVTAKYYQEWDIMNPVEIPAEEITVQVSKNAVVFAAPTAPAGAIVCFSYEAGAFKDIKGNSCGALNSGLNMNTGKFAGAYVQKTYEAFEVADAYVTSPAAGALIAQVEDFKGEITFPFNIYRNDATVEAGDLSVTYKSASRTVTYNLTADQWSVEGTKLSFVLPATPAGGDMITFSMVEGAVTDVLGNPNAAYNSALSWQFFAPTVDMILGAFEVVYVSYWSEDGSAESMGKITIEQDPETENGVIIKDMLIEGSVLKGVYDLSTAKLYIPDSQVLGIYTNSKGTNYGLLFATADGSDAAAFTINADGTLTGDGLWGFYAFDETFATEVGWFEVAKASQLVPVKSGVRKGASKVSKVKAANFKKTVKVSKAGRSLKKHIRK